jgi:hypothetical protein
MANDHHTMVTAALATTDRVYYVRSMLHIRCGDDIRQDLRRAGIPGEFKRWIDPSLDGPPPDISREDDVVLWFEHDLFDQAILIRLLASFAEQDLSKTKLQIVSRDSYPGVKRFIGFGNLDHQQIADCFADRREVTREQLDLGRRAWQAYNSADPSAVESLIAGDTSALPYLKSAMVRYLQELPSVENGLTRTEQILIECVAEERRTAIELFLEYQRREETPWLGDTMFFARVDRLSGNPAKLIDNGELTVLGRRVLAHDADYVREAGLDAPWRWDPAQKRVVRSQ